MVGSGTTVVEAVLEGRRGIGVDIDPLAWRLGHVKTEPPSNSRLRTISYKVLSEATKLISDEGLVETHLANRFDVKTKKFIDYWFLPDTQRELMALVLAIEQVDEPSIRHFLELTLSAIIITKSGGVSRARDLVHSRPHLVETKVPKNALERFSWKLSKNLTSVEQVKTNGTMAAAIVGDARSMPLADEIVDLIVTSPPYANAIDYMRAHKFSLVWLGKGISELAELRSKYLGSERVGNRYDVELPSVPQEVIIQLERRDPVKARILRKYFDEMRTVLSETLRVLRPGAAAVLVVGTSTMRGLNVQTHQCLAEIAADRGFDVVGIAKRTLERNKRMMPARFGNRTGSLIEQRMHEEYVIGLLKPSQSGRTRLA